MCQVCFSAIKHTSTSHTFFENNNNKKKSGVLWWDNWSTTVRCCRVFVGKKCLRFCRSQTSEEKAHIPLLQSYSQAPLPPFFRGIKMRLFGMKRNLPAAGLGPAPLACSLPRFLASLPAYMRCRRRKLVKISPGRNRGRFPSSLMQLNIQVAGPILHSPSSPPRLTRHGIKGWSGSENSSHLISTSQLGLPVSFTVWLDYSF